MGDGGMSPSILDVGMRWGEWWVWSPCHL